MSWARRSHTSARAAISAKSVSVRSTTRVDQIIVPESEVAMDRAQRLQEYTEGYSRLRATLADVPAQLWRYKPAEEEWSVREVIIHLADSEVHSYIRCRTILAEPCGLDAVSWTGGQTALCCAAQRCS